MRWPWSRASEPAPEAAPTAKALPPPRDPTTAPIAEPAAAPSPAPAQAAAPAQNGPGNFTSTAKPVTDPSKPAGGDGVAIYGGFLVTGERNPKLIGREKWVTYDNAILNVAIVGSAVNVWTQLGGSAKWTAEPNKRGGDDAKRGAEIVAEGLFENQQLSTPWAQIVRRQLMKKFRGFALHEATIRRRNDGLVVFADLLDRPQWSVYRWDKADEQSPWRGIEQQSRTGNTYYIERERLFYSVENTLSPSPEGVGLLRMLAEPVRVLELYQQWEGIGFQTDLRGMPIGRAPIDKLMKQAEVDGCVSDDEKRAYVNAHVRFLADFLTGHNKTPDQGMMLDSATYTSKDAGQSPSSIYEWAFDLVKGASSSMPEVGTAIGRLTRDIARVMCAEWLLLGGEDSGGAYSMHADKTAMFALIVNSALADIAADAQRDLAARLVALNGLDPETCTPILVPEPIAATSAKDACTALQALAAAALDPRDKAINVLRSRLDLPAAYVPDEAELMLQRSGGAPGQDGGPDGGQPAGDDGEEGSAPAPGQGDQGGGEPGGGDEMDDDPEVDALLEQILNGGIEDDAPDEDSADDADEEDPAADDQGDDLIAWLDARKPVGKSATFDESKHPRADDGKWSSGGAHGHIDTAPRDIADRFEAFAEATRRGIAEHAGRLDAAHRRAGAALADLHALEHGDDGEADAVETDTHDLFGDLASSQQALHSALGLSDDVDYQDSERSALDPNRIGTAEHARAFTAAAGVAQTALEDLHQHQADAAAALQQAERDLRRGADKATSAILDRHPHSDEHSGLDDRYFAQHARWGDDDDPGRPEDASDEEFKSPTVQQQFEDARRAAEEFNEAQQTRVTDAVESFSLDDAHDALKDAHRETARAIRALAKRTGRAPKLATKRTATRKAASFDESKHPRATDGRFGHVARAETTASGKLDRAKARLEKIAEALKAARAARDEARKHAVKADATAKRAALKAKKNKTKKNVAAAKAAKRKLDAAKAKHDAAKEKVAAKAEAHSDAKAAHKEAHAAHRKAKAAHDKAKAKAEAPRATAPKVRSRKPSTAGKPAESATSRSQAKPISEADYQREQDELTKNLTTEEREAAIAYSGYAYKAINDPLREGRDFTHPNAKGWSDHLDSVMSKAVSRAPVITYRWSKAHPAFMDIKVGDAFTDNGFVSTSILPEQGRFINGVQFHIMSPRGTKIAAIPSKFEHEKEMLLARGSAMRVDKREQHRDKDGNLTHVFYVTVIGQPG